MGPYSYETGEKKTFEAADYAVFGCTLGVSAAIGVFYAIKDRNRNTTEEYLLGGRSMHPIPVAMSLLSSFISAITILGNPAEVYVNGIMFWWVSVGVFFTCIGAAHIFVPIFYNLGITSIFQYTEVRFGRVTRVIAVIIYMVWMIFYMAIVLYAPSLALNAVTGLHLWGSVIAVGAVCIFYTCIGGMKAVLWADTVQMVIVYAGMLTVLILGSSVQGGFGKVWEIAKENGRTTIYDFETDPRLRHSTWSLAIGGGIFWCAVFGTNQAQVQRAMAVKSESLMKLAVWLNFPGMASIIIISSVAGVVMYSFYSKCDPVTFGLVSKADQLLPLFMMDLLWESPGLPGLLLSTVFSGSLSTISSGLNALAAVTLEDFVRPMCCKNISSSRAVWLSRIFVVVYGAAALAFAFIVSEVGSLILQLAYALFGVLGGPLLGMFSLGMLFPWANKWGGGIGISTSVILLLWIGMGASINKVSVAPKLPVYVDGCNWNMSHLQQPTPAPPLLPGATTPSIYDKYDGLDRLYSVSYMWYSGIGVITTVVVGLIVSFITGPTDPKTLNPKLICPFFDVFFPCLPEKIRKKLRFGVRHGEIFDAPSAEMDQKQTVAAFHKDDPIPPYTMNGSFENKGYEIGKDTRL